MDTLLIPLPARRSALGIECLPQTESFGETAHVLAIDSDPRALKLIADYLRAHDMRVTALPSAAGLSDVVANTMVDAVVMDAPASVGSLRAESDVAIILLSSCADEADRVMGLELGADDYMTKPFSPRELLARIRAVVRRARRSETVPGVLHKLRGYRFAGWELNVRLRRLTSPQGEPVHLTKSEFNLLAVFLAAPQRLLTRGQLIGLSRLHDDEIYDRSIDVQVARLRRKIPPPGAQPPFIRTERGVGYAFTAAVEPVR